MTEDDNFIIYRWRDLLPRLRPALWLWLGLAFAGFVSGLLS